MKEEPLLSLDHVPCIFFNPGSVYCPCWTISAFSCSREKSRQCWASGCGKSTILNILSGLLKPTGGTIERKGSIGYMFQRDHLLDWRTIYENVLLGLEIQKQKKVGTSSAKW